MPQNTCQNLKKVALSPSDGRQNRAKGKGECRSDLEDLAFRNPPLKEPDRLGRRACIEYASFRVLKLIFIATKVQRFELIRRRFTGAEKDGEGRARKISTEAETISFALR